MSNTEPTIDLYQKITDICFENGGATKPMVDQLYELISDQVAKARIEELEMFVVVMNAIRVDDGFVPIEYTYIRKRIATLNGVNNK